MASQKKLQLIIEIVSKQQQKIAALIAELEKLNNEAQKTGKAGGTEGLDELVKKFKVVEKELDSFSDESQKAFSGFKKGSKLSAESITAIATSFIAVQSAIQTAFGLAQTFYAKTIGLSEQLNQQLLKNAANIAATSRVEIGGNLVEGVEAVKALQPELRSALKELEVRTENIAGVTDDQVRTAFDAVIGKVGLLNGQTKQFNNSIEASTELAASLTAALSANNLSDTTQIYQEIGDLLTGDITADSQLARALAIDRETILRWQQQGELVDQLIGRLGDFEDSANLAANSISNVASNFVSLTERISREGTEDLLDPVASSLLKAFNLVSDNESAIIQTIQTVIDSLGEIGQTLLDIASPVTQLGDDADVVLNVLLDGVQGIQRALEIVAPLIKTVVAIGTEAIEVIVETVEVLRTAFNLVAGGLKNASEALEAYSNISDVATQSSENLLDVISRSGKLTESQRKQLGRLTEEQIKANQEQIRELREFVPASEAQRLAVRNQIVELENLNEKLEESKGQLGSVGEEVKILARELPDVADTFEEVADKTNNALQKLADGSDGSLEKVQQNIQQVTQGINQLFDAGEISGSDAITRLNRAIEAPGLELEQKLNLANEVRKIQRTVSDEKVALLELELTEIQAGLTEEERANATTVQNIAQLREQALQGRLTATREAIAQEQALIESGAGSQQTLRQLQRQQREIGAELKNLAVENQRDVEQARLDEINRAQAEVRDLQLESRRQIFREEQALLEERGRNAAITEQQIQARIAQLTAQNNEERLRAEVRLQEQRVQVFEEGTDRRKRAEQDLADLRQQLNESVAATTEAARNVEVAAIETLIQDEQRLQDVQKQRLEFLQAAEDRVLRSLNTQREIYQSQIDLIDQRNRLASSLAGAETEDAERALQIRKELDETENLSATKKKQLEQELRNLGFSRGASEKKIAEEILERKQQEIELEAQALQSRQSAERSQLVFQNQLRELEAAKETRREQARLRELEFQKTLLELEESKAAARGDARGATIASEGIDRIDESIGQQQQAIAASQQQEQAVEQINQNALRELSARQAQESFEFARNTAQEAQSLATQLSAVNEQVGRRAQRFANQADDIADGARIDAQQTLNSLQSESVTQANRSLKLEQDRTDTTIDTLNSSKETAEILEGQLSIETQLADTAERRLKATQDLNSALGDTSNQANVQLIPSLDTGGPLPTGQTAMIHSGEVIVPGAPTRSAALDAIATGKPIQAVKSDGFYKGTGGYVLNRQDVQGLATTPVTPLSPGTVAPVMMQGTAGAELSNGELARQTELLQMLVAHNNDKNGESKRIQKWLNQKR